MSKPRWFSDLAAIHDPRPLEDDTPVTSSTAGAAGLSRRDLSVLGSLAAYRWLTTRQIERLHFRDSPRTPLAATRAAHRSITRLYDRGLVARLNRRIGGRQAGSAVFIWRLTPAGARIIEVTTPRSQQPGIAHLAHALDVAELVVRLHERARQRPVELVAIETEPECWRRYTGPHHQQRWLKPDLRLTLRVPGHELHWFVEVDRGSEHRPTLQRKVTTYVAAWRDGAEQARAGVFPRVLWVVPSPPRATTIEALCTASKGAPPGLWVVALRPSAVDALLEPPR